MIQVKCRPSIEVFDNQGERESGGKMKWSNSKVIKVYAKWQKKEYISMNQSKKVSNERVQKIKDCLFQI